MGAKTSLVAHAEGDARKVLAKHPEVQEAATASFVASLYPSASFGTPRISDLTDTYVRDGTIVAGCFTGLRIVVSEEISIDRPSQLPSKYIAAKGTTILHAMHSAVDWFAFAIWEDGVLRRSLSIAPDSGVVEDIGNRMSFEKPYWDGAHPAVDPEEEPDGYPLPFHPLELGEAALLEFFGFQLEGIVDPNMLPPDRIRMLRFEAPGKPVGPVHINKPWWKLW